MMTRKVLITGATGALADPLSENRLPSNSRFVSFAQAAKEAGVSTIVNLS